MRYHASGERRNSRLLQDEPHANCTLVKDFIARQGIIFLSGIVFLTVTYIRVKLRHERRNTKTFFADCSKQAGQQLIGGVLMVSLGVLLAERGFDSLAWYGAQYPFEIVMTTAFTGVFKKWLEVGAIQLGQRTHWKWLTPFKFVGQYGPKPHEFRCRWYGAQLVQAVFFIGLPARLCALCIIWISLYLPDSVSPVRLIASGWFHSGLSCETQTLFILYIIPLTGDAVQFVIIDRLQSFGFLPRPVEAAREFDDLEEEAAPECDSCLRHRDRDMSMEAA